MNKLESILLATNLGPASKEAGPAAARLAARFGARVTLLHVLDPDPDHQPDPEGFAGRGRNLEALIADFVSHDVVVAESAFTTGTVADSIVAKAEEVNADLIVLGPGERPTFGHYSLGPSAEAVLERAHRPVLVLRPGDPPAEFQKVLCAVDHSEESWRGLRYAVWLTRAFRGELVILTVVPPVGWLAAAIETGQLTDVRAAHARRWHEEFDDLLGATDFGQVTWSAEVRHGIPAEEIANVAREVWADVLVIGTPGHTGIFSTLTGGVTHRIHHNLPCSLLTVKEEPLAEVLREGEARAVTVLVAQGRGLLAAHSYGAAVDKFRRALAHDSFCTSALENLAEALAELGRNDEADFCRWRARALRTQFHKENAL